MGRKSKVKGAAGERELAAKLRELGFLEAHRGRQYHGGTDSPDVAGTDLLHFECKRCESISLYAAMKQAIADAGPKVPLVAHRRNNKEWLLVLRLDDIREFANAVEALYFRHPPMQDPQCSEPKPTVG